MRLERKNKFRREDDEESWSSWAYLEKVESRIGRGKRLAEHAVTDLLSPTHNSAHSTNDFTRPNNGDKDQARGAGISVAIRPSRVGISKPRMRHHAKSRQYQHRQGRIHHKTDGEDLGTERKMQGI